MVIKANYIDIFNQNTYTAAITIESGIIVNIAAIDEVCHQYILPGFVDAHIHIESSMLVPSAFAPIAVQHGTVATVSDPHEIANVCGVDGVHYMLSDAAQVPFKFNFGAPSCVPATTFETAGATADSAQIKELLALPQIKYLSEVMNYPGVLNNDAELMEKLKWAKQANKPIDGHAPGVMGEDAIRYIAAGISTDHECYTYEEALHKLQHGMKILIREGSAAKNFDALIDLMHEHYQHMMFCCDDKHPDELLLHHINHHVQRAIAHGVDLYKVLRCACINPVQHYKLDVGLLRVGDAADFILVKNVDDFEIIATYINGNAVYQNGTVTMPNVAVKPINNFKRQAVSPEDFLIPYQNQTLVQAIEALDGQLITKSYFAKPKVSNGFIVSDTEQDVLQIAVINRYSNKPVANALIKNIGIKNGALASTVAHDSHNIIVVGTDRLSMAEAANKIIEHQGGIASICTDSREAFLPLPIAGIMSNANVHEVAAQYKACHNLAKEMGSPLSAPFMTLSFMALLVIPQIKLSDLGLFDGGAWEWTQV
jgi:adenine deaminase